MARHNDLGKKGEAAAAKFLAEKGYEILALNYVHGKGEIDIIAKHKNTIIFCEVKTRSTDYFGLPEESVTMKKIKMLKKTAEHYLFANKLDTNVRFDIVSVIDQPKGLKIYHLPDAFFDDGGDNNVGTYN